MHRASRVRQRLGIWEVTGLERGVGAALADQLTREERFAHDVSSSGTLHLHDTLLAIAMPPRPNPAFDLAARVAGTFTFDAPPSPGQGTTTAHVASGTFDVTY